MVKKGNDIMQYRERLEKTLALSDLTNNQKLKTLVKSQFQQCNEKVVETRTTELCNFLDMLRSASGDNSGGSSTSHPEWKLKQDNEEFRVMYREGPKGTPFHTLLVEGYVDGPLDVSLCLSWESVLYKKWWPQFTIPSFKVLVAERLQRVQIGEQISRVRMKVPWPLSAREAIVHYYLFEYFQDDLVVVLLKTVPESKIIDGFNKDVIPEAKDVVRIDVVGGYVMQKVTSDRSYFRIIANLDLKLDFVPPTLINFISRQVIGSGFKLYQKAVASIMTGNNKDKDISKALEDSLYVRIRKTLCSINGSKAMDGEEEELKQETSIVPTEELIQSEQDGAKDVFCEDNSNQCANNYNGKTSDAGDSWSVLKGKGNGEIVDAENEDIVQAEKGINIIPIDEDDTRSVIKGKMNVYVRSDVRNALETIERVISTVREYGYHSLSSTSHSANGDSHCMEKGGTVDSSSAKLIQVCLKNEVSVKGSPMIQNFGHAGTNGNVKEVNYNKVVPASLEQSLSRPIEASLADSYSLKNGTILDQTICDDEQLNSDAVQDMSSDDLKKSTREIKYRFCCFMQ
uniref:START domain-containing protein n=1 Tax=Cajanus cajan TaxID=3821 RepID=A0A151SQA6_CAJCA|nr:hypothetical protein KK1_003224 [Cajanus cajan]